MSTQLKSRKRRIWLIVLICFGLCVGVLVLRAMWPIPPAKLTVSRETTYYTEPLNPDGTVNYVAALNQKYGKGVTRENNAAIGLIRAFGPEVLAEEVREKILEVLGMESFPEGGEYFVDLSRYVRANLPPEQPSPQEATGDRTHADKVEHQAHDDLYTAMAEPWSAERFPMLAGWLRANERPLATLVAATHQPQCFFPLVRPKDSPRLLFALPALPRVATVRNSSEALLARAMLHLEQGDILGARADLIAAHRLARLVGQGPSLMGRTLGNLIENGARQAGRRLAADGRLTAADAKTYLAELEACPPLRDIVEAIDEGERLCLLDAVMHLKRGGSLREDMPSGLDLEWDLILRACNGWHDRVVAAARQPTSALRHEADAAIGRDLEAIVAAGRARRVGHVLVRRAVLGREAGRRGLSELLADSLLIVRIGPYAGMVDRCLKVIAARDLTLISLALSIHKTERGAYPATLSALAPEYLKAVPEDVFADKHLIYRREAEGYVLYSVGPNMKDDGGREDDEKDWDDIVVRVE